MAKSRGSCRAPSLARTLLTEKAFIAARRAAKKGNEKHPNAPLQNRLAHHDARLEMRELERRRVVMEREVVDDARLGVEQCVTDEPFLRKDSSMFESGTRHVTNDVCAIDL